MTPASEPKGTALTITRFFLPGLRGGSWAEARERDGAPSAQASGPSRKNKQQRCSKCGGLGHKSRTCMMAQQQQPDTQATE